MCSPTVSRRRRPTRAYIDGLGGGFCGLFGATVPFSAAKLALLYPTHGAFVKKWDRAATADVREGYLLPADAKVLDRVASGSPKLDPARSR